jgi:hypothetical protein
MWHETPPKIDISKEAATLADELVEDLQKQGYVVPDDVKAIATKEMETVLEKNKQYQLNVIKSLAYQEGLDKIHTELMKRP